ncbi:protein DPCD-like [Pomacea canaliculata]|uniref:protein DPCD-like n=1 Tax=Pomacea canaliculata TaxID=400727 RepID=UPI000D738190|nr:protein DPCD-like [Pomacea canaliculata]
MYPRNNMATAWLEKLKSAQKTCLIQDDKRKIHFTFPDGTEMAEEYDLQSKELFVRKWRKKGTLGGSGKWETEVGDETLLRNLEVDGMMENYSNPIFVRKDTKTDFQWRIRNLPYPICNYNVTIDGEKRQVVVRTENKKYYKRFNIPDMDRLNLDLKSDQLSIAHANNTLVISYHKPQAVLEVERTLQEEFKKMKAAKDGDVDCNPS